MNKIFIIYICLAHCNPMTIGIYPKQFAYMKFYVVHKRILLKSKKHSINCLFSSLKDLAHLKSGSCYLSFYRTRERRKFTSTGFDGRPKTGISVEWYFYIFEIYFDSHLHPKIYTSLRFFRYFLFGENWNVCTCALWQLEYPVFGGEM